MPTAIRPPSFALALALALPLLWTSGCDKDSSAQQSSADAPKDSAAPQKRSPEGKGRDKGPGKDRLDFGELDADGDGKLVKSEVPDDKWERLVKADSDGDGAISKKEFEAHRPPPPRRRER